MTKANKMPQPRSKNEANPESVNSKTHIIVASERTFLSLPTEARQLIFTNCIESSQWVEGDDEDDEESSYRDPPPWYLSVTIPQSLLLVAKQIRQEALNAMAVHHDLAVVCNVFPSGEVYPGYIAEGNGRQESPPPRPTTSSFDIMSSSGDFGRVRKQCAEIPSPKGLMLMLKLHADGEGTEHGLVDELEAVRRSVAPDVFLAAEYLPQWQHVHIDLDGVDEAMKLRANSRYFGVPDHRLDEYLVLGWQAIVEESQPLRAKAKMLMVGLKGWRQDSDLEKLEKICIAETQSTEN